MIVVYLIAVAAILWAGRVYYDSQKTALLAQREAELTSIRDMKSAQIAQWRSTLLQDGTVAAADPSILGKAEAWIVQGDGGSAYKQLRAWMAALVSVRGYAAAKVISSDGSRWISVGTSAAPTVAELAQTHVAVASGAVSLSDLYQDPVLNVSRIDVVAPLMGGTGSTRAVLVLQTDPSRYLYPLIKTWPVPSASAETLLLRRGGDEIVFLNDLRFKSDAALTFSVPTSDTTVLGVQAVSGAARVIDGVDYRHVPSVGAVSPVPGSDWFIVAKLDRAEVYAPIDAVFWSTVLACTMLVLLLGAGFLIVSRQNTVVFLRERLEAEHVGQQRLNMAVQGAPLPIMIHAEDGEVLQVNRAWHEISGYTLADIPTTADWAEKAYGAEAGAVHADIEALYGLSDRVDEGEYTVRAADGRELIWDFSSAPLGRLPDGRRFVMSAARDVTARKRLESELRTTTATLMAAMDQSPAGIAIADAPDGKLRYVNDAGLLMRGGDRASIVDGVGIDQYVASWHLCDLDGTPLESDEVPLARALMSGEPYSREFMIRRDDHEDVVVLGNAAPIKDGEAVIGSVVVFTDITQRKRAEIERDETSVRLRALLDNAPYGAHMYDLMPDDRLVFVGYNQRACELLGMDHQQFMGMTLEEAFPGNIGTDTPDNYRRVAREGGTWRTEQYAYADDHGIAGVFEVYAFSYGPRHVAVFFRDVTDIKRAEIDLQKRTEELERSNAELEKFAYVASHDLQEPLRMVASYTQLLQKRYAGRLDSDADEFIGYAVEGAARMRTLINDLLAYSRVGTQGAAFVETDLDAVLTDVLSHLGPSLQDVAATVTRDPLPTLTCDPTQLGQVFQNLISNAAKFHGSEPPLIHVGARREGPEWVFSVSDNGIGIDPQYFDRVFVIFQRLESRAKYPGTGIGLAISKRIIGRHGGRIWVESQPGAGSTFFFTLRADEEV